MTFTINYLFYLVGIVLLVVAGMILTDKAHPRRLSAGVFWLIYALIFLAGNWIPVPIVGVLVVAIALIVGFGGVTGAKPKMSSEETHRQRDTLPERKAPRQQALRPRANDSRRHRDPHARREVSGVWRRAARRAEERDADRLRRWLRDDARHGRPVDARTRRLIDALSWAAVLPQMLGMLGLVFSDESVGKAIAHVTTA